MEKEEVASARTAGRGKEEKPLAKRSVRENLLRSGRGNPEMVFHRICRSSLSGNFAAGKKGRRKGGTSHVDTRDTNPRGKGAACP